MTFSMKGFETVALIAEGENHLTPFHHFIPLILKEERYTRLYSDSSQHKSPQNCYDDLFFI